MLFSVRMLYAASTQQLTMQENTQRGVEIAYIACRKSNREFFDLFVTQLVAGTFCRVRTAGKVR